MFFTYQGVNMFYKTAGQGKPVLLLHGWGGCADSFLPVFEQLSADCAVYAVDFPGHGQSDTPPVPWTVSDYCGIIRAFIQQMGIEGCDVICHSFGGRVTIKLAAQDPKLFSKLVFCDAAGVRPKRGLKYYFRIYRYKLMKNLAKIAVGRGILKCFGIDWQTRMKQAGSADYRALPDEMKKTFSNVVCEDLSKYLKRIQNPTLLIWGTEDEETPLWMAKKMEREIRDSGLIEFEGAGHFAYLDQLGRFLVIVRQFLF